MARGLVRKDTLTKNTLLRIIALGAITIAASTSPYFLHYAAKTYFKDRAQKAIRARAKKLRELEKRKLISFKELGNGTVRIELAHHGKTLVRMYTLETMQLEKPKQWDRRWRILLYDIPAPQRRASNAFREKVRHLGLFPLQRSVWVSPYECLAEIEFLATIFEIDMDRCIGYFNSQNIPREKEVRKFFNV